MRRSFLRQLVGDYRRKIEPAPLRPTPEAWSPDQVTVAWLGHATVLINFFGLTILTDPVFFARIGLRFGPLTVGQSATSPAHCRRVNCRPLISCCYRTAIWITSI